MRLLLACAALTLAACQSAPSPADKTDGLPRLRLQLNDLEDRLLRVEDGGAELTDRIAAARLALRLAVEAPERRERLAAADRGLAHSRQVKALAPKRVEGPYLTGVLIGRRLQNEAIPSPSAIATMQAEAERAAELDPGFDHAGPLRFLGLLYAKAPPWPMSIGDLEEAEDYLKRALETAPGYPENWLAMAEMLIEDKRSSEARDRLSRARALLEQGTWSPGDRARMDAKLGDLSRQLADG